MGIYKITTFTAGLLTIFCTFLLFKSALKRIQNFCCKICVFNKGYPGIFVGKFRLLHELIHIWRNIHYNYCSLFKLIRSLSFCWIFKVNEAELKKSHRAADNFKQDEEYFEPTELLHSLSNNNDHPCWMTGSRNKITIVNFKHWCKMSY